MWTTAGFASSKAKVTYPVTCQLCRITTSVWVSCPLIHFTGPAKGERIICGFRWGLSSSPVRPLSTVYRRVPLIVHAMPIQKTSPRFRMRSLLAGWSMERRTQLHPGSSVCLLRYRINLGPSLRFSSEPRRGQTCSYYAHPFVPTLPCSPLRFLWLRFDAPVETKQGRTSAILAPKHTGIALQVGKWQERMVERNLLQYFPTPTVVVLSFGADWQSSQQCATSTTKHEVINYH